MQIMIPIRWLTSTLCVCVCVCVCVLGLIQREDGSMEKELEELRRSRKPKPLVGGDFSLSDCFYFSRRGIESIIEDEVHFNSINKNTICYVNGGKWFVIPSFAFQIFNDIHLWIQVTQRFTSEELVSWNLLTRTNNDFQYISLRLTLVYGLGIFVRYCILAPLRYMNPE